MGALIDTITPPKKLPSTEYAQSGRFPIIDQSQDYIAGWTDDQDALISSKLPLIVFGDHTCALKFVGFPFAQGADGIKILYSSSNVRTEYLYQSLCFNPLVTEDYKRHYSTLRERPVAFPKRVDEQREIAECLSSVDELIAAEGRKLNTLRDHKKGLVQRLFPNEGDTSPRLRFHLSGNPLEWVIEELSAVATYENGKAYEQHIAEQGKYVVVNARFISTEGRVKKFTNAQLCTADIGDVLLVLSDLPKGKALAKCFLVSSKDMYAVNQRVARITPTDIRSSFLFYSLNRARFLLAFDDGLNQTHLAKDSVLSCPIAHPQDKTEQSAIADCLSSVDELILAQGQKIATLKLHKNGLMQQLFPQLDEAQT